MRHTTTITILCGILTTTLATGGCTSQTGPDSNTGVFKTPEQAADARKQKLLTEWQEMASKIANADRPDVHTTRAAQGFGLNMSADGIERAIDLTPLTEKLSSAQGKEREPIRAFLADKFPELDRARLTAMGFEGARGMLRPVLANSKQTLELTNPDTTKTPITNDVVLDLNWVPVIRWPGTTAQTAVDPDLSGAWKVSEAQVSAAAIENEKADFAKLAQPVFETVDLPGLGRYGNLRSGVDPAVLLLPEFLAAVRKGWAVDDDLVVSMPSRITVNFLERKNERLLNRMIPEWSGLYAKVKEPMISTMLLVGDKGVTLLNYAPPSTRPASKPTTKPRVYIVH